MKKSTRTNKGARKAHAPPKAKSLNRTQLAREYGVSLQTVDSWVRRGCPHKRHADGGYAFKIADVRLWRAAALADDSNRRGHRGRPIPEAAREWLDSLMVGYTQVFPWSIDCTQGPERDEVAKGIVPVDEYRDHYGLDGDELLFRVLYGLPLLPPAPDDPKQRIRLSLPHAKVWHFLFAGCIENLGGDGMAKRIAMEAQRIRGFPIGDPNGPLGKLEDGDGVEASP